MKSLLSFNGNENPLILYPLYTEWFFYPPIMLFGVVFRLCLLIEALALDSFNLALKPLNGKKTLALQPQELEFDIYVVLESSMLYK